MLALAEVLRMTLVVLLCSVTVVFGLAAVSAGRWKSWLLLHLALLAGYGLATKLCQPATAVAATMQIMIGATRILAVWEVAADAFREVEEWRRTYSIGVAAIVGILVALLTYRPYYTDALWNWRVSWECGTAVMAVLLILYYWKELFPMPALYQWYGLTWGVFVASYAGNAVLVAPANWDGLLARSIAQYSIRAACIIAWIGPLLLPAGRRYARGLSGRRSEYRGSLETVIVRAADLLERRKPAMST